MHAAAATVVVLLLAAPALAHGGAYTNPPSGNGTPAAPGFGGPTDGGPVTRWESWWADDREDILRIAERVDALKPAALTLREGEKPMTPTPDANRATRAALVREDIAGHLRWAIMADDFDIRSSAAIALGKLGDGTSFRILKNCAEHDPRDEVRRAAVFGIGILGRDEDLPYLCTRLADRTLPVDERSTAALAIGLVGGDDAAQYLSFFIEKDSTRPDPKGSQSAQLLGTIYAALGMTGSVESLRALWRGADDETLDPALRAQAVLGLARARDHSSSDRLVNLLDPANDQQLRRAAVVALGRVVTTDDAAVVRALSNLVTAERDPAVRRFAIRALAGVGTGAVKSLLRGQFREASDAEKPFLALALGMARDAVAAPLIRDALKDSREESARSAYCMALGLIGEPDSLAALEREIGPGSTPGTYRGHAALALAVFPSPGSAEMLWKRMPQERDARVWGDMAIALGMMGDRRARSFLVAQMKDGDGNYDKCRAASCLGVLRSAESVPDLVAVLRNPRVDGVVRALAVVALGQIGDISVVPRLTKVSAGTGGTLATPAIAEALSIL